MDVGGWLGLSAMLLLGIILVVLLMQYIQFSKISHGLGNWRSATLERQQRVRQQAKLQSALRAEQAHVQQFLHRVEILQTMLPAVSGECQ